MIKANELRLGNILQDEIGLEINLVVYRIEEDVITCGDEDFSHPYLIETLLPIPLTSEILQKAGFKDQKYYEWEAFAYKDTPICAFFDGAEWCFKYGYDADLVFASCMYVHSLQNLIFVLTGKELSISL